MSSAFTAIRDTLHKQGVEFIRFECADLHGISRSKKIPLSAAEGFWRNGVNIYGGLLGLDTASEVVPDTGVNEERRYADRRLIPDSSTLMILPYQPDTASVICDIAAENGEIEAYSPREILRQQLARAAAMDYDVKLGHEYEFYLLDKSTKAPLFEGLHIFNTLLNESHPAIDDILKSLLAAGIPVITHNAEYAGSQFEINYAPTTGLAAADRAFRFKSIVKEVADRHGLIASFMSKPSTDSAGSGCHLHLCLQDSTSGDNAFWDQTADSELSGTALSFIAGSLDHAAALSAFTCPTVNCYHRLKPHTFAPSNISWGVEDRAAMIRAKASRDTNTHLELRLPSAMSNPYLIAAGWLIAGLDGIERDYQAPAASQQPAEDEPHWTPLPTSLLPALDALQSNEVFNEQLPESFRKLYQSVKRHELSRYHAQVTEWERNEYLTLY